MSSASSQAPAWGHPGILEQVQVLQDRRRVQPRVDTGALRKLGPTLGSDLDGRVEGVAGRLVQSDEALLEEELPNLVAGHLLTGRALSYVEPASEGVRLAVLLRDCDRRVRLLHSPLPQPRAGPPNAQRFGPGTLVDCGPLRRPRLRNRQPRSRLPRRWRWQRRISPYRGRRASTA